MITWKELRKKTMPPEKKASTNKCIVGHYLVRPLSDIISIPLIEAGVRATPVTIFSSIFPILAFAFFAFLKGDAGFWLGWLSLLVWNILDGVDGNIARYTDTCSRKGELWDATVGWAAVVAFYFGMGMVAAYKPGIYLINNCWFVVMGAMASIANLFPRLIMQKKNVLMGTESVKELKERADYGVLRLLVFNLTSINGLAAVLMAVAYLFDVMGLCTIFYFLLNAAIAIGSLYKLLR